MGRGKNSASAALSAHWQELSQAVEDYVSGEMMYVNQMLRRGDELSGDEARLVRDLDEATNADVVSADVLYRSVDAAAIFGNMSQFDFELMQDAIVYGDDQARKQIQAILDRAKPGTEITERGFMSTSEDYDVISDWYDFTGSSKAITLELSVPQGTRGLRVASAFPEIEERMGQSEILLPRNTKYRIRNVTTKDGLIYVKAEII